MDNSQGEIYIIARIGERHYPLAAVYAQKLFGVTAATRCLRLVRLFSDPGNRLPLQQELLFARDYFGAKGADVFVDLNSYPQSPLPFPFISTCLFLGAASDPETGALNNVMRANPKLYYDAYDKWGGVTILDITDLDNVRYCFVAEERLISIRKVPLDRPLDAWMYVLAYSARSERAVEENIQHLQALEQIPVVTVEALKSAWPEVNWNNAEDGGDEDDGNWDEDLASPLPDRRTADDKMFEMMRRAANKQRIEDEETVEARKKAERLGRGAPSLMASSVGRMLDENLHDDPSGFPLSALKLPTLLRSFRAALRDHLLSMGDTIGQLPNGLDFLKVAFSEERHVDLSRLTSLSVIDIQSILQHPPVAETITSLALPVNSTASLWDFADSLPSRGITEFYSLGNPRTSMTDGTFSTLYQTARVTDRLATTSHFAVSLLRQPWLAFGSTYPPDLPRGHAIQLFLRNDFLLSGNPKYDVCFLGDALLTPQRLVAGLFDVLRYQADPSNSNILMHLALGFAGARWPRGGYGVSPLPAELYYDAYQMEHWHKKGRADVPRDMPPGSWSVVVVKAPVDAETQASTLERQHRARWVHDREMAQDDEDQDDVDVAPRPDSSKVFRVGFVRAKRMIRGKAVKGREVKISDFEVFGVKDYLAWVQPGLGDGLDELQASLTEFLRGLRLRCGPMGGVWHGVAMQDIGQAEVLEVLKAAIRNGDNTASNTGHGRWPRQ